MDIKKFEKDMAVFSFGQHQDVLTYLITLERGGWTIEDAQVWVENEKIRRTMLRKTSENMLIRKCSECTSIMIAAPVNINPETETGDDSTLVYTCINQSCMHQIFE